MKHDCLVTQKKIDNTKYCANHRKVLQLNMNLMSKLMSKKSWIQFGIVCTCLFVVACLFVSFREFFAELFYQESTISNLTPNTHYWSWGHFISIYLMFAAAVVTAVLSLGRKKHANKVFAVIGVMIVCCTLTLLTFSLTNGIYRFEWYVPLHICNVFTFLIPLCAIFKSKVRAFFSDYLVWAGAVGCVLAVVFPMTSLQFYPPYHLVSICIWMHHVLMLVLSTFLVFSGIYRKYNWFSIMSIIWLLVIASAGFNKLFGTNFLFLNNAYATFPIDMFQVALGEYAVWIILVGITFVAFGIQFAFNIFEMIKNFTVIEAARWVKLRLMIADDNRHVAFVRGKITKVLSAEVVAFIQDSTLENITDPSYVYENLKDLGFFEEVLRKLSWKDKLVIRMDVAVVGAGN